MQVASVNDNSINFGQAKFLTKLSKSKSIKRIFADKMRKFPKDYEYLKVLANGIGLAEQDLYRIRSIVGPQELEAILSNAKYNSFDPGIKPLYGKLSKEKLEELAQKGFLFNLHTHTTHSDGIMSIKSLLNQSAEYANILKTKASDRFIIAITDHDTLEGCKKALEIISKNPEQYENLGIVLGAELSALYREPNMLAKPFAYELIAYSINPFQKNLNTTLTNLRKNRIDLSKSIIKDACNIYPEFDFSYQELCKSSKNPKKGIDGFLYSIANYLAKKTGNLENVREVSLQHLPKINEDSSNITNSAETIFNQMLGQFGFLGIAHPGKIYLGGGKISDEFIKKCKSENKSAGKIIIDTFLEHLKKIGNNKLKAIETNYQSYEGTLQNAQKIINASQAYESSAEGSIKWLNNFREFAEKHNLLNTGGLDTHSENPFLRK